jgi:hypothetical protein
MFSNAVAPDEMDFLHSATPLLTAPEKTLEDYTV